MQTSWDEEIDDLRSWGELEFALSDRWREVRDRGSGLLLTTHFDDLLVEMPPTRTDDQRRLLRELGFRPVDDGCWSWTPAPPSTGDLRPTPPGLNALVAAAWAAVERDLAIDRARSAMALRVLREVCRASPPDLAVVVPSDDEDDEWDDDDDDDSLPGLDCAALEARFGPGRRTTT
jgi:hypothetical protein